MRIFLVFLILAGVSCKTLTDHELLTRDMTGDWLILYPENGSESKRQKELYGMVQDSIVGLMGLKLVSFEKDGTFYQVDSTTKTGKWTITSEKQLVVTGGGKGFDSFRSGFYNFDKDIMELIEFVQVGRETLKLVWKFKKLDRKVASRLFGSSNNWRLKPSTSEDEISVRARLASMLNYYSEYYKLVSEESSFFVSKRVLLPFQFYQHSIGLRKEEKGSYFSELFYDSTQAARAHDYLRQTMYSLKDKFPSTDNYVEEYALFMGLMAKDMARKR